MERESFEDPAVGKLLNRGFVSVKVDREERPDVDALAMSACQALTGGGGWPTTVLMTPDKKPFFAGTYFPRDSRGGHMGLLELLTQAGALWREDRRRVLESGEAILGHLNGIAAAEGALSAETVRNAVAELSRGFDRRWGGFGVAPKFPTPHNLLFLLRFWKATGDADALLMAEATLASMFRGGIYDPIGYGFARYATDRQWLIPHFEKMLYDNALLALAYCEAFAAAGNPLYRRVAGEIFSYVLRDMTDPGGGFYSAEDADSEGAEGKFYLWPYETLLETLTAGELALFSRYYPVSAEGNFEDENLLNRIGAPELPGEETAEGRALEAIRRKLFALREQRVHPFKDDKILSGWNGLMIAALSMGGRVLDEPRYTRAAAGAAAFILEKMTDSRGRLRTRYRDGQLSDRGFLDDYAYFVWGLLELFEAGQDPEHLERAIALSHRMHSDFGDENGGFFLTAADGELPLRTRETYDGALPSGNAVAAMNLVRLGRITGDPRWDREAEALFAALGGEAAAQPLSHTHLTAAFLTARTPSRQLVLAGRPGNARAAEALKALRSRFLPFDTLLAWDGDDRLAALVPFLKDIPVGNEPAAYLCADGSCRAPSSDLAAVVDALR